MTKAFKVAAGTFTFICAIGFTCSLAGGVEWGTFDCGMFTTMTALVAVIFSIGTFIASGGLD